MIRWINEREPQRMRRARRTRASVRGTSQRPRLSVFRSNRHIFVELIDDVAGRTLASASDLEIKARKKSEPLARKDIARGVGAAIAKKATAKDIHKASFDRGRYKYHGMVMAVAEGARQGGLQF